jgi:tricorn protease
MSRWKTFSSRPALPIACCCLLAWGGLAAPAPQAADASPSAMESGGAAGVQPALSFSDPALSPDGSLLVFAAGGDLWAAPAAGGGAYLVVAHPATESRPLFSPDGGRLAFVSNRTGNGDVYVLTFATGEVKRITWDDDPDQLDGWSRDGRWLYFSSSQHDLGGMNDLYRVSADGGTPLEVSADRYLNEYAAAPSPDGRAVAFSARGMASAQWWRQGHSHIDQSEIWLLEDLAAPRYRKVSGGAAKSMWPMWSPDGGRLYFMSDKSGAENLWTAPLSGASGAADEQLTRFTDGRLLWPTISYDGRTIVFERDFRIWKYDVASRRAEPVAITLAGAPVGAAVEHRTWSGDWDELALSPDGKKVAFVVHGEVFAAAAKDGGRAARVTATVGAESQVAWAPDSRRLVYVSDRDGTNHLYLYDFATGAETRLTAGPRADDTPRFSPDGKLLAFQRDRSELRALDLATKQETLLAGLRLQSPPLGQERPFVFSPDGRWIALLATGDRMFRNVLLVPVAGGGPRPVSFLANSAGDTVSWSPDGKFLLFDTGQRSEVGQIARVDLVVRTPKFREEQFRELFHEETPPAVNPAEKKPEKPGEKPQAEPPAPAPGEMAKQADADKDKEKDKDKAKEKKPEPVEVVFDGIRRRLTMLPVGVDVSSQTISPDGKWVAMLATVAGQSNVYVYSLDELAKEPAVAKQLTATAGDKAALQFTPDSKQLYYLEDGGIRMVSLESHEARPLAVTADMDIDFAAEKLAVFDQAWRYLRDNFVDPGMHGLDWQAERARYLPHVLGARTPDEMRRVVSLMIGDLNASHSGIRGPGGDTVRTAGYLGLRFDRGEYEASGRLRVTEVTPLGPAAVTGKIEKGTWLLAVDGQPVGGRTNLDRLLDHKAGREVKLAVARSADGAGRQEVAVRPVDNSTAKGLEYRAWVESRRAYVDKASGGRLGYVHMFDMNSSSLNQLYLDLDAENQGKEGVVVDVRNNNGGFVNAYAIDELSRRGYVQMAFRGFPAAPSRAILGQRALERPSILVTNQHSLSDSELFTEGYRTLKVGKVVGEPTAGWIIYTSNVPLLDGSSLRLPFIRILAHDGEDMEMHPRAVDVPVDRLPGEDLAGKDVQLDVAVRELLAQIGQGTAK